MRYAEALLESSGISEERQIKKGAAIGAGLSAGANVATQVAGRSMRAAMGLPANVTRGQRLVGLAKDVAVGAGVGAGVGAFFKKKKKKR